MAAVPEAALTTCVATWPSRSTRLPRMLDRIVAEPYDTEAWAFVLQETAQQPQPEHFRPIFGRFVALFPTAAGGWRQYIEAELRVGQLNAAENLFGDCLVQCPELELLRMENAPGQPSMQASILVSPSVAGGLRRGHSPGTAAFGKATRSFVV